MEIRESQDEILSDIIVFDKNTAYENYILVFELIPENEEDYQKLALAATENLSLSIYSFAEFSIVEIPFKKIDMNLNKVIHFGGVEQKNNPEVSVNAYPLFKMTCNFFGYYEIRVEGLS